ncbi:hypothetical protein ACFSCX_25000 [Bacillus salitolerans]|uniref:Alpha/beta hydrolase n=1 Tax=Bacillus salitolerans TaxID=1437434 RepID=A0ABW4LX06_9BACI
MSWLELGMALNGIGVMLGYVIGVYMYHRRMIIWVSGGVVILGLHLIFEGYRVQMMLIYLLTAFIWLSFIMKAFLSKRRNAKPNRRQWKRMTVGIVTLVMMGIALSIPLYVMPQHNLPQPTGVFTIGTTNYHWVDENRLDPSTEEKDDNREVSVRLWYPADPIENMVSAPYAYSKKEMKRLSQGTSFYINILLDSMKHFVSHSYVELPVSAAETQFPILVLSPGFGASNFMYTSITEELASNGYIVAAIEHPYYTEIPTLFPDGRKTDGFVSVKGDMSNWDNMNPHIQLWTEDVQFVLDQLDKLNKNDSKGIFDERIDLQRIGMLGHSFGGATAVQVMSQDSRVLAGVNMDGFPYGPEIEEGLPNPFLYIFTKESNNFSRFHFSEKEWKQYPGLDTKEKYVKMATEFNQRKTGILKNGGEEWVVSGTDHMSFSDVGLYSPLLSHYHPAIQKKINEKLLHFFDKHVKK